MEERRHEAEDLALRQEAEARIAERLLQRTENFSKKMEVSRLMGMGRVKVLPYAYLITYTPHSKLFTSFVQDVKIVLDMKSIQSKPIYVKTVVTVLNIIR